MNDDVDGSVFQRDGYTFSAGDLPFLGIFGWKPKAQGQGLSQYEEQVEEVVTGHSDGSITFAEEFTNHT